MDKVAHVTFLKFEIRPTSHCFKTIKTKKRQLNPVLLRILVISKSPSDRTV